MKKYLPIAAFAAVALASLAMAAFAYVASEEAARIKFEATADEALNRIESRVNLHLALLRATDAYFTTRGGDVSGDQFNQYVQALDIRNNFEGLQGIGMLGMGREADTAILEQDILRRQGIQRSIFPASDADRRTPIVLYEPIDRPGMVGIGYDMFTDPLRRDALVAAIETGEPRATGRVLLGQVTRDVVWPGFLIFSPVEGASAEAPPSGMLFAAFRAANLFKAALEKFPALPVHAEVYDGPAAEETLLFKSEVAASPDMTLSTTRQLLVAGMPWTIEFRPTAEFSRPSSGAIPIILAIVGLTLAFAIALVQRYQGRAYDAVALLQQTAEQNLLDKEMMLQEMKHRIKNSITRVLAIARQTASGAKDIGEFSESFSARLQAMAASQDLLTRSSWQKADLGELLRIELSQAFGKELPDGMLSGPPVLLSETATQALGLTFHELATNALKYGESGSSADALKVRWSVSGNFLSLSWAESSSVPVVKPEKLGFGTRLIEMNITRELKGTIRRDYLPDGLRIHIEIPLEMQSKAAQ